MDAAPPSQRAPLLRTLALIAGVGVVAALSVFWIVTIPAAVAGLGAAAVHAKHRQRPDDVQYRRLRVVPCRPEQGSRQGRSHAARRRLGTEIAIRHFLRAKYLARSQGRHRRLERGGFRHGALEGNLAARNSSFPGLSIQLLPAHGARRRARSVRLSEDPAAGVGPGAPARSDVSLQHSPAGRRLEASVPRAADRLCPTRQSRRNGIAALIWSTVPGTAPSAIARAISSAASSKANASPAGRPPTAKAGCPTSRRRGSAIGGSDKVAWSEKDIASFLDDGMNPAGDFAGGGMAEVIRNTSLLGPDDRAAIAAYIASLPPVQGPTPPPKKD